MRNSIGSRSGLECERAIAMDCAVNRRVVNVDNFSISLYRSELLVNSDTFGLVDNKFNHHKNVAQLYHSVIYI